MTEFYAQAKLSYFIFDFIKANEICDAIAEYQAEATVISYFMNGLKPLVRLNTRSIPL